MVKPNVIFPTVYAHRSPSCAAAPTSDVSPPKNTVITAAAVIENPVKSLLLLRHHILVPSRSCKAANHPAYRADDAVNGDRSSEGSGNPG
jgi:hypothetical protein